MRAHVEAPEALVLCEFLMPIVRNGNRQEHEAWVCEALHSALYERFGGYTVASTVYSGTYRDASGECINDVSRMYKVALAPSQLGIMREILKHTAKVFDQESVFLSVQGNVEFVN